ncbi:alpha/beta fold hydrolase [Saccharothrix syringae]|uniref:Alpha/beta hydrolase n=1 Tax=Saccharothrix syringae TaxID=103733 RepID=A0A5Q0GYP5_SACSY|nr:alpha/beta hydrolase [Saccharothrix syringae]QFZ18620.1 alpha/beta hydrolase [Saccharothrix syringae]
MRSPASAPEGFEHAYAEVNGVKLHYVIGGEGPLLVLVHGWPFSWIEFRALLPLLAARGFRVVAPDLRGSGDSSIPDGHWTKQDEADDLHRLLRHLGHDNAFVLGTDVGTMTVHAWAQRYPRDVTRLVLSECFLPGFGLEEHLSYLWHFGFHAESEFAAKLVEGREEQYLSWFYRQMIRGGITEDDHAELLRTLTRPGGMRGGFEHYATVLEDGRNARAGGKVEVPVLVLHGEYGLPSDVLLNGAREAATDVRAEIVPDAAHTYAADNPHATADVLTRFFAA